MLSAFTYNCKNSASPHGDNLLCTTTHYKVLYSGCYISYVWFFCFHSQTVQLFAISSPKVWRVCSCQQFPPPHGISHILLRNVVPHFRDKYNNNVSNIFSSSLKRQTPHFSALKTDNIYLSSLIRFNVTAVEKLCKT